MGTGTGTGTGTHPTPALGIAPKFHKAMAVRVLPSVPSLFLSSSVRQLCRHVRNPAALANWSLECFRSSPGNNVVEQGQRQIRLQAPLNPSREPGCRTSFFARARSSNQGSCGCATSETTPCLSGIILQW